MKLGIVILHYRTEQDTFGCVSSIKNKLDTDDYSIIIVDNCSDNGSVEKIEQKYENDDHVIIIKNEENIGFARGLNVGIHYARNKLRCEFVLAINNDTELISSSLYQTLKKKYNQYHFALLGPMVICSDGVCSVNPITDKLRDMQTVQKSIDRYKKLIKINELNLLKIYFKLSNIKRSLNPPKVKEVCLVDKLNVRLHGCFWIFSEEYFKKYDGLDEATFLYMEEDVLYLHLMMNGLRSLYTPDIIIYHKECSSTKDVYKNSKNKYRFVYSHCVESQQYYIQLWKRYHS